MRDGAILDCVRTRYTYVGEIFVWPRGEERKDLREVDSDPPAEHLAVFEVLVDGSWTAGRVTNFDQFVGKHTIEYAPPLCCTEHLTLARERDLALGWLDVLPHAETLCAAICLKGLQCDSAPVKSALAGLHFMRVHSCVEEPGGNENGHEGVCAFRFLLDNYEKPWQHVFFLHGDANTPHHVLVSSELTRYLKRNEWPVWPARYADI